MKPGYLTCSMVVFLALAGCVSPTTGTSSAPAPDAPASGSAGAPADQPVDTPDDVPDDVPADVTEPPTVTPPTSDIDPSPTFSDDFGVVSNSAWKSQSAHGVMTYAVTDALAADQKAAYLSFNGGQTNAAGPGNSTQIETRTLLGFGTYRARVNFAKCAATEDLVNGIFVYSNDGSDNNGNGIIDNNEIDIELLCGSPTDLYLTIWTDYKDDTSFKKVTRLIDLKTGNVYETPVGHEGTYDIDDTTVIETIPEMKRPTLATDDLYYELGFEWHSNQVRYFIVLDGKEVTLWNFTRSDHIPKNKAYMMFNLWHPTWSGENGEEKDYPASAQTLKVDWFKYWAE